MSSRRLLRSPPSLLLLFGAIACSARGPDPEQTSAPRPRVSNTVVITADEIEKSGATTVWQALRRLAPQFRAVEHNGRPVALQRRGRSSLYLNDGPLVFLDGMRLDDLRDLDLLPASQVETISILGMADGATYYGVNAVGGVIAIRMRAT